MCYFADLSRIHRDGPKMPYMGGKMTQVVHLDEVELILELYQIRPLIAPFNPVLIHLPTALGGRVVASLISTLIRH